MDTQSHKNLTVHKSWGALTKAVMCLRTIKKPPRPKPVSCCLASWPLSPLLHSTTPCVFSLSENVLHMLTCTVLVSCLTGTLENGYCWYSWNCAIYRSTVETQAIYSFAMFLVSGVGTLYESSPGYLILSTTVQEIHVVLKETKT